MYLHLTTCYLALTTAYSPIQDANHTRFSGVEYHIIDLKVTVHLRKESVKIVAKEERSAPEALSHAMHYIHDIGSVAWSHTMHDIHSMPYIHNMHYKHSIRSVALSRAAHC